MEQKIKARIVLAHADTNEQQKALPNELILYDFEKPLANNLANKEIRLRIGDGTTPINILSDLTLDNMNFYNSKPANPETGDVWYNEAEETFYLENSVYEEVEITKENYKPNIYYKWLTDKEKYVLDTNDNWVENQNYYVLKSNPIKLSHVIENIEDGLGKNSIQITDSSKAGSMCFRFDKGETHTQNEFYLLMTDEQKQKTFNVENKKFSMKLDNNFDYAGVATSLENGILKVQTLTATHNGAPAIPGTEGVGALAINEDSFLFFPGEPDLGTDILGEGAVALGIDTKAQSNASFAEGRQTVSAGQYAHAEGRRTNAIGYSSHAEGIDTKAIGQRSHAEGDNTIAEGYGSHAQGQKTEAIGKQSHAEGVESIAKGDQSHAEGLNTYTQGQGAHSEGIRTAAIGPGAHAEGRASTEPLDAGGKLQAWGKNAGLSIAEGEASHIEGIHTHTGPNARAAHAEGELTEALGANAHAEGKETQATGEASHAEGVGTIANGTGQHVQGKYNEIDENNDYAHIVGNGNNHYERSNIHTLDWDGNTWFAGDIKAEKNVIATGLNIGENKVVIDNEGNIEANSLSINDKVEITNDGNLKINDSTILDSSGNITTSNGTFNKINVIKGENEDETGTGYFENGIAIGGKHYGSDKEGNQYPDINPVLNLRGTVISLDAITDAKAGDIVCIENLIEQKLIEFKVPKKEDGYMGDSIYPESTYLSTNEFRELQATSPYGKIVAFLLNDNKTYNITKEEWENSDSITHSNDELSEFKISFTFGDNNKTSIFTPNSSLRSRNVVGYGDPDYKPEKEKFYDSYSVKGNLFYDGQLQDEFHNHDVIIKYVEIEKDMPPFESVPEELRKYAIVEPQETSNYYLYDGKEWNDLTYNGKQLQNLLSNHCMPTIGYSKNNKYKVNVGGENIVDLLKQAFADGETIVYVEPGTYTSSKVYQLPKGNFTIVGLGDVNFNFAVSDIEALTNNSNRFNYKIYNIIFLKPVGFENNMLANGDYAYNYANLYNCTFYDTVSIWPDGKFYSCSFYKDMKLNSNHSSWINYENCRFYDVSKITGKYFYNCDFYYSLKISAIYFGSYYPQLEEHSEPQFKNCTFQLLNKNINSYNGIDLDNSQKFKNKVIIDSSFLVYPFENIECIDEETCYINPTNKEIVIPEDFDMHYKGIITSADLNNLSLIKAGDLYKVEDKSKENYKFFIEGLSKIFGSVNGDLENAIYSSNFEVDYGNNEIIQLDMWINDQQKDGNIDLLKILLYLTGNDINNFFTDENDIRINKDIIFDMYMGNGEWIKYSLESCSCYKTEREGTTWAMPPSQSETYYDYQWNFTFKAKKPILPQGKYDLVQINQFIVNSLDQATNKEFLEKYYIKQPGYTTNTFVLFDSTYNKVNLNNGATIYRGGVQTYEQLPEIKNIGDMYIIYNSETISYDKKYNNNNENYYKLSAGTLNSEIIEFVPDTSSNNQTFKYTCYNPLESELAMSLAILTGSYDYEQKTFKSVDSFTEIPISYSIQNAYSVYDNRTLNITKVTYYNPGSGGSPKITFEGYNNNNYESEYSGNFKIQNLDFIISLEDEYANIFGYLEDKRVYKNIYPSGPWVWSGKSWDFIGTVN